MTTTLDRPDSQFQVIDLIGGLTNKPELHSTEKDSVATLGIAVQRRRGKDGQDRGAGFIHLTAFGSQAENCAEYLTEGRRVGIVGRLHHSEWDSDDGRRRSSKSSPTTSSSSTAHAATPAKPWPSRRPHKQGRLGGTPGQGRPARRPPSTGERHATPHS